MPFLKSELFLFSVLTMVGTCSSFRQQCASDLCQYMIKLVQTTSGQAGLAGGPSQRSWPDQPGRAEPAKAGPAGLVRDHLKPTRRSWRDIFDRKRRTRVKKLKFDDFVRESDFRSSSRPLESLRN